MHTKLKAVSRSLITATLLASAAWVALAQTSPERGMQGRMDPHHAEALVVNHLAGLKAKLKITPAQESSWTTFAAAMTPTARPNQMRPDRAALDKMTTPDRLDALRAFRTRHAADRQATLEKRDNAVKTFYADLYAEQRVTFDAEHSKLMQRWDRRKDGHGRHGDRSNTPAPKP